MCEHDGPYVKGMCKNCYASDWRNSHPEAIARNAMLARLRSFGITQEEYEALREEQQGRCAICLNAPSGRFTALAVDHNHETGRIRGLLCNNCNRALGLLGDTLDNVARAANYLKEDI